MREALDTGAVILGRAGAAALRHEPDVLRVRLFGARRGAARARDAGREHRRTDRAPNGMRQVDRARAQYVRRLYRCDVDDPALYHLQIDSTVLSTDACVDLIVTAFNAFNGS